MPSRDEALARMRDALQFSDPEWDVSIGTPEYKIIEAVAQEIENLTIGSVLGDYHFDIDKKSGDELDRFVALFGFSRIQAKRASGIITFSRGQAAPQDYSIPIGTQAFVPSTPTTASIYFLTSSNATMPKNGTSVDVPIEAVVAGTSGNVVAGAIINLASVLAAASSVSNAQPLSGGRDSESDEELRLRWKRTVFRNVSGTEDQFLAVCFTEPKVNRANVVGPVERFREQLQVPATCYNSTNFPDLGGATTYQRTTLTTGGWLTAGTGTSGTDPVITSTSGFPATDGAVSASKPFYLLIDSTANTNGGKEVIKVIAKSTTTLSDGVRGQAGTTALAHPTTPNGTSAITVTVLPIVTSSITDTRYTYPTGGEFVGHNIGLTTQALATRITHFYMFTPASAAYSTPTPLGPQFLLRDSSVFPIGDVFEGDHEFTPMASRNVPPTTMDKVDILIDGLEAQTVIESVPMDRTNFVFGTNVTIANYIRDDGQTLPKSGNYFMELTKSPIASLPSSLSVNGSIYYKDEDYWLLQENETGKRGSSRSLGGIEWNAPWASGSEKPSSGPGVAVVVSAGNVTAGWHAYVYTFVVNGIESISSTATATASANDASNAKNNITIATYGGGFTCTERRVYRSKASASSGAALAGPFFLVKTVQDNTSTAWQDNKSDTHLKQTQPPSVPPVTGDLVAVSYSYNATVEKVNAQVNLVRLVGMDTSVHQAQFLNLKFNFALVLRSGVSTSAVEADIKTSLAAWLKQKNFQDNIQVADVIDIVASLTGVDNVRLLNSTESANEIQTITAYSTAGTPSATSDTYTLTVKHTDVDPFSTGSIPYNAGRDYVRTALEALPHIDEGNPEMGFPSATVTDNAASFTLNPDTSNTTVQWPAAPFYVQVDDEVILVGATSVAGPSSGASVILQTLSRGQFGSIAASHTSSANVRLIGDIAVYKVSGSAATTLDPLVFNIIFLKNQRTLINNWGIRVVPVMSVANLGSAATTISEKQKGSGYGIQIVAANGKTILTSRGPFTTDFYLNSDEIPVLYDAQMITKARNTF